jgi:hypothetical protein
MHSGIGCSDPTCKTCVCDLDAACCTEEWDDTCVSEANNECAVSCTCEVAGSCCEEHFDTLGCDDTRCQDCVCAFDSTCCSSGYDGTCADIAATNCHGRCDGCGVSDCCDIRDDGGCEDAACEDCVCAMDDFCCSGVWDGSCADTAADACNSTCLCLPIATCVGDCNGDGEVNINELIIGVGISLTTRPVTDCPSIDQNSDGQVLINELVLAVNAALSGC